MFLISTKTCPNCKMAKKYLDDKGVSYQNLLVDNNEELAEQMIKESGQMGVPFIEFVHDDGHTDKVLGFDKEAIDQAISSGN